MNEDVQKVRWLNHQSIIIILLIIIGIGIIVLLQTRKSSLNQAEKPRFKKGEPAPNFTFPDLKGNMVSLADYKGKVVRQENTDYLVDNPSRRCPVIEKARTRLGYNPTIMIDEGLKRSLIWYSHNKTAEEA